MQPVLGAFAPISQHACQRTTQNPDFTVSQSCHAAFMSTRPSVMGPMRSSPPCDRHAAELTLLSVVDAKAATLCLLEGAVSLSRYACSSCDDHWPCNGFTASTVP